MGPIALGLDGGGTKTACAVVDGAGRLLGAALAGPSNLQNEGPEGSAQAIRAAVGGALESAHISPADVAVFCLGLGGLDTPRDFETYRAMVADLATPSARLRLENDVFVGLASGTWGDPGVAVVAGTGSIAGGMSGSGERARAGGWGYLISDEGSAFAAGRGAVAAVLQAQDGTGPSTALLPAMLHRFGASDVSSIVQAVYAHPTPQTLLAAVAPLLDEVAQNDETAAAILTRCGRNLARLGVAVAERLDLLPPVTVVAIGGMFSSRFVMEAFSREIAQKLVARIVVPACDPVAGAAALALRDAGVRLTRGVIRRLERLRLSSEAKAIGT